MLGSPIRHLPRQLLAHLGNLLRPTQPGPVPCPRAQQIPVLCVFAQRYRSGLLASRGHPVRSKQVQEAVRSVATGFTRLGLVDPRLNCFGLPLTATVLLGSVPEAATAIIDDFD
mgnify:CR=1 FL=1